MKTKAEMSELVEAYQDNYLRVKLQIINDVVCRAVIEDILDGIRKVASVEGLSKSLGAHIIDRTENWEQFRLDAYGKEYEDSLDAMLSIIYEISENK